MLCGLNDTAVYASRPSEIDTVSDRQDVPRRRGKQALINSLVRVVRLRDMDRTLETSTSLVESFSSEESACRGATTKGCCDGRFLPFNIGTKHGERCHVQVFSETVYDRGWCPCHKENDAPLPQDALLGKGVRPLPLRHEKGHISPRYREGGRPTPAT